jgi:hypothetical protein
MRVILRVITTLIAFGFMLSGPYALAQDTQDDILLPDRCPEPCDIGGKYVSEDYQRLTVPFRIRNGKSGNYLKINGRGVSVQPIVEDDDSFLWVLLPGPDLIGSSGDVSEIITANGFENKVYKLLNLKASMALMSSHGSRFNLSTFVPGYSDVYSTATHLGDNQFWLFQRDLKDAAGTKYLIYNPKVRISRPDNMYDEGSRADITPADANRAKMGALTQVPGRTSVGLKAGADLNVAEMTWVLEEAAKPRDLARLTIKSVKALQVSTGRDSKTEILSTGILKAIEYGPFIYSMGSTDVAKKLQRSVIKSAKGIGKSTSKDAGKAAAKKSIADQARTFTGNIANTWKKKGLKQLAGGAVKSDLKGKLVKGTITIGAAPFRGVWWLTKTTGKAVLSGSKKLVKLGTYAARTAPDVAKAGLKKAGTTFAKGKKVVVGWVKKNPERIRRAAEKAAFKQYYRGVIKPLLQDVVGNTAARQFDTAQAGGVSGPTLGQDPGSLGGDLADLKAEQAKLTKEWGGGWASFMAERFALQQKLKVSPSAKERSELETQIVEAGNREFVLENLQRRIKEIEVFEGRVKRSRNRELLAADVRQTIYTEPFEVSVDNYSVCADTKTYAIPQRNPPYFRIDSGQNIEDLPERAKTLSDAFESIDGDAGAAAAKVGEVLLDVAMLDFSFALNEITKATDKVDDQLEIRIDGTSVWPNGGNDWRHIGSGQTKDVRVEYLFRRGDDVRIDLIEYDSASDEDSLGSLTIPTTQLYDIEEYEGAYIQQTSEGSLYEVTFTIEPLYAPTPSEVERKAQHDVDCAPVLAQAKAEEFAYAVEQTRIEGRLAVLETLGENALRVIDNTVAWADFSSCRNYDFYGNLPGEWRVGKYDAFGVKDRSVTWTNTFNTSYSYGVGGDIVTPSDDGRWRNQSLSPGKNIRKNVVDRIIVNQDSRARPEDREPDLVLKRWEWTGFESAPDDEIMKTAETCEIYAAMFDRDGLLGGAGDKLYPTDGQRQDTVFFEVGKEYAYAMRPDPTGATKGMSLHRIADKTSKSAQAVSFLQDYYITADLPEQPDGVEPNLLLTASGPADVWLEKISDEPGSGGSAINTDENLQIITKVKETIVGSWEIGPYKANAEFPQKVDPEKKRIWFFAANGTFFEQPENDFWFNPPIVGTWKYIGDQRIEVTTSRAMTVPLDVATVQAGVQKPEVLGTTFIVKMAQKPNDPTDFTGFYVQDSMGRKAIWSKALHPGKSPHEVPELYSEAFFALLEQLAPPTNMEAVKQVEAKAAANKVASAAMLEKLVLADRASPCSMEKFVHAGDTENSSGYSALQGKWRVGQFDTSGNRKYDWNYQQMSSPFASRDLNRQSAAEVKAREDLARFRSDDVKIADDPAWAFFWRSESVPPERYQQEWVFPQTRGEKITVRLRLDNPNDLRKDYNSGDLARPDASFHQVEYDEVKKAFVMKQSGEYDEVTKKFVNTVNHNSPLKYVTSTLQLPWSDGGCQSSSVTLPDAHGKTESFPIKFFYHKNGHKEFYITRRDGSLYLWGKQDADLTKYYYIYGEKFMTPEVAASECKPMLVGNPYPFTFYDENLRGRSGQVMMMNEGAKILSVFRDSENYRKAFKSHTLRPGDYAEFTGWEGEKFAVIDAREPIFYKDRFDVCAAAQTIGGGLYWHKLGEGFKHPTKVTDTFAAREACGGFIGVGETSGPSAGRSTARLAVVDFKNEGTEPMEIFRLGHQDNMVSPDGNDRTIPEDFDPFKSADQYVDLKPITVLEPGSTFTLHTRVGYAFKAIKRGTERLENEIRETGRGTERFRGELRGTGDDLEQVNVLVGDPEICIGKIKVTDASETISFGDAISDRDFDKLKEDRDLKSREDKRIANNLGLVSDADPVRNVVSESAEPGTPVGLTALAIDGDAKDTVSYAITAPFKIDPQTGVVMVDQPLDREATASHTVTVTATSSDSSVSVKNFEIALGDANEFALGPVAVSSMVNISGPIELSWLGNQFRTSEQKTLFDNHSVNETAPVGSHVATASAVDKDVTDTVRYSLSYDAGGVFVIDPESGVVRTAQLLDYETQTSYVIEVVATSSDGSISRATSKIQVSDVSDNPVGTPEDVDPTPNTVTVNVPDGTIVGITALALDTDAADKVTYSLGYDRFARADRRNVYEIDPVTGVITTGGYFRQIDLEAVNDPYASGRIADAGWVTVNAKSSDGSSSLERFQIEILDENESTITNTYDSNHANNQVAENAGVGTPVGITAMAKDYDALAKVSYKLTETAGGRFALDAVTGVITVAGALDFETAKKHSVTVLSTSSDGSTSQLDFVIDVTDFSDFSIGAVTDIDQAPNTVSEGEWSVDYKRPVGITAFAKDADVSASVSYSLKGGQLMVRERGFRLANDHSYTDRVFIDMKTGVVGALSVPAFETSPTFSFTVIATSNDGSTSEAEFTMVVMNVDEWDVQDLKDADPTDDKVVENAPIGTPVGITATATDRDRGERITYSLKKGSEGGFAIDQNTGIVTVAGKLDAEEAAWRDFTIVAKSSDGSTTEKDFVVIVIDVNEVDVGAVFDVDPTDNTVDENAGIGAPVGLVAIAHDGDQSDRVTFALISDAGRRFAINSNTGGVSVAGPIGEGSDSYTIEVVASSTDGSQSRGSFTIFVNAINKAAVGDMSDADPQPNGVDETAPVGTLVGVTAFAQDGDKADTVSYSIDANYSPFAIDPTTGGITVGRAGILDAETQLAEIIPVKATSTDGSISYLDFEVAIYDVNEVDLSYMSDIDNAPDTVSENAPDGTPVGLTLLAEDFDRTDTVTYRMGANDDGLFTIDPLTGVVTVAGLIDYEAIYRAVPSFEAVSTDGSAIERSFEIKILPENDFDITPFDDIDPSANEVSILAEKNSPVGIRLAASDPDEDSGQIIFAPVDSAGNEAWDLPFGVQNDGVIYVNSPDLFRDVGETDYTLYIRAKSSDGSERIEPVVIAVYGPEKWYNNPQGPRVEEDYGTVPEYDRKTCVAADEDVRAPATFNNEIAYFDCLDRAKPNNWYDDPRDPRGQDQTVYGGVTEGDWDSCVAVNEDKTSAVFNNEAAFYDCLDSFKPSFVNWYDDPKDWRSEDPARYAGVAVQDWGLCVKQNEDASSRFFNDEVAFYNCADLYLAAVPPLDTAPPPQDDVPVAEQPADVPPMDYQAVVNSCAAQFGIGYEPPEDRAALITLTNNTADQIGLIEVSPPGTAPQGYDPAALAIVDPGTMLDVENAKRSGAYAVLSIYGDCLGGLVTRESRNSLTCSAEGCR